MVAAFASVLLLWLCGRDVVPRNRVVGIRLPALLASDAAWRAGHSAAVGPAGAGALVGALVLAVSALGRSDSVLEPILVVIVMIGALGWAAVVAVRAARHAPSGPEREVVDHTGDARPLASVKVSRSGGVILAAIVAWAPPVIVTAHRLLHPVLPTRVPSHWTFDGRIDGSVPAVSAFWVCLGVGALGAAAVTAFVVFVGDDIGRVSGSIGLGSLTVLTGSFALMWITAVTAAETPSTSVFLLVPVGLLIGSLVFVLATIRPPGASATTSSE